MTWSEGQELQSVKRGPISREHLKHYASASGDMNPIHLDDEFAKQAGYPSVIAHGMLSMAFLGDLLRENFPSQRYWVKNLSCRFKKITYPGDELLLKGKVKKENLDGEWVISLWIENQKGEVTTQGEALIQSIKF